MKAKLRLPAVLAVVVLSAGTTVAVSCGSSDPDPDARQVDARQTDAQMPDAAGPDGAPDAAGPDAAPDADMPG